MKQAQLQLQTDALTVCLVLEYSATLTANDIHVKVPYCIVKMSLWARYPVPAWQLRLYIAHLEELFKNKQLPAATPQCSQTWG